MSAPRLIPWQHPIGDWLGRSLRGVHREEAGVAPYDLAARPGFGDLMRLMMYGNSRIELSRVFRPNGSSARQMVISVGVQPFGRIATRLTLNDFTGVPNAIHGEIILGWKPFSVGASLGRSRDEVIVNWFKRYQPSITATNREITRLILRDGKVEVQRLGELKHYGRSLSTIEMGRALTYQLERQDLREAFRLLEVEGRESAVAYLRQQYPHAEEEVLRRTLLRNRWSLLGFGGELLATFGVTYGMSSLFPNGPVRHAAQNGAAYAVANLFRAGWRGLGPSRLSASVAEGVPIAMIHGLIGLGIDQVENAWDFRWRQRWIAEDFGSLAVYGSLKASLFPRFLAVPETAASVEGAAELGTAASFARPGVLTRFVPALALTLLAAGAVYCRTRPRPRPLNWEEFQTRFAPAERARLGLTGSLVTAVPRQPWRLIGLPTVILLRPCPSEPSFEARRAGRIIARLLEGGSSPGLLSADLAEGRGARLLASLGCLPNTRRAYLASQVPPDILAELDSLARESDETFFYQGLASLAYRVGEGANPDLALSLWYVLVLQTSLPYLQERAKQEFSSLLEAGGRIRERGFLEP